MKQKKVEGMLNNLISAVNILEDITGNRVTLDDVLKHTTTLNTPDFIGVRTEQSMSNPFAGKDDFSQYKKEVLQSIKIIRKNAFSLYKTNFNIEQDIKNQDYVSLLWHLGEHKLKGADISTVECKVNLKKLYSIADTVYDLAKSYEQMGYENAKIARKFAEKVRPGLFTKKEKEYVGNLNLMTLANYLAMKNIVPERTTQPSYEPDFNAEQDDLDLSQQFPDLTPAQMQKTLAIGLPIMALIIILGVVYQNYKDNKALQKYYNSNKIEYNIRK